MPKPRAPSFWTEKYLFLLFRAEKTKSNQPAKQPPSPPPQQKLAAAATKPYPERGVARVTLLDCH